MNVVEILKFRTFLSKNITYGVNEEENYLVIFTKSFSKDIPIKDNFEVSFFRKFLVFKIKDEEKSIKVTLLDELSKLFKERTFDNYYIQDTGTKETFIIENKGSI